MNYNRFKNYYDDDKDNNPYNDYFNMNNNDFHRLHMTRHNTNNIRGIIDNDIDNVIRHKLLSNLHNNYMDMDNHYVSPQFKSINGNNNNKNSVKDEELTSPRNKTMLSNIYTKNYH